MSDKPNINDYAKALDRLAEVAAERDELREKIKTLTSPAIEGVLSRMKGNLDVVDRIKTERDELRAEVERLKADGKRLDALEEHARKSRTGISFDWCRHVEDGQVTEHGFRFMRHHFLGERKPTLREAIDAAMKGAA